MEEAGFDRIQRPTLFAFALDVPVKTGDDITDALLL
ncbi:hypothetical protein CCP3SC1_1120004 [Gammaproteobacteria bacterium]